VIDETSVYWANDSLGTNGAVAKVPLGGGRVTTLVSHQFNPLAIAVHDGYVYWVAGTGDPTLFRIPARGGAIDVVAYGVATDTLFVDEHDVYYADGILGGVYRVALDGGASTTLAMDEGAFHLVSDGARGVWYDMAGNIESVSLDGGQVSTVVSDASPLALAVGGGAILWSSPRGGDDLDTSIFRLTQK
jgi:hypothetical protein